MANINTKLEYWKNRLLDLGKRNRLINCPLPKSGGRVSRTSLLINTPDTSELWDLFDEGSKALVFPIPPIELKLEEADNEVLSVFNNGIETNQTPSESYKTLHSLMKKAKEFNEEKGLNALHLAFGFLNWKENGAEGQEMRSPLLLMPVKLTQEDLFSPILLSRAEDELTANYSLEQKLISDFGIELPVLTEDTELNDYISKVKSAVSSLGWSVSTDVTQLSLFSFMKINMYRDLERNADKIKGHQIVRTLNGETFKDASNISDVLGHNHDTIDPQSVFSVVDADSSQQDAILLAKCGASFVLQGPPGTGKSQTITNIIAELIADGKKVLFVSEKMAALEVVYKRLCIAGLGDFCLTLHSHNAKRREILDQFEKSIKLSRSKASLHQEVFNKLYRLKEVRATLNAYSKELHTVVEPLGKTIFQVNGFISQLEMYKNIDYVQANAENFTQELLSQCESALEELERIVRVSGYQQHNPWKGCTLTQWTHEFKQQFIVDTERLVIALNNGIALFNEVNAILGVEKDWSYSGITTVAEIFAISEKTPTVPFSWTVLNLLRTREKVLECKTTLEKKKIAEEQFNNAKLITERILVDISSENNIGIDAGYESTLSDVVNSYNVINAHFNSVKQICDEVCKNIVSEAKIAIDLNGAPSLYITTSEYNELLTAREERVTINNQNEEVVKDLVDKKAMALKTQQEETKKCETACEQYEAARKELLVKYDEKIIDLDLTQIIQYYRTTYRSWFARIGGGYRNYQKTLLSFCKTAVKLKYEDSLTLIDCIDNVQTLRTAFETQKRVAETAEEELKAYCQELVNAELRRDKIAEEFKSNTTEIQNAKGAILAVAQNTSTELKHSFDEAIAKLRNSCKFLVSERESQASNLTAKFANLCDELNQTLGLEISESFGFVKLIADLDWLIVFQDIIRNNNICDNYAKSVCEDDSKLIRQFAGVLSKLQDWKLHVNDDLNKFADLFGENGRDIFYQATLSNVVRKSQSCNDNFAFLQHLIDYRNAKARLVSLSIDAYLNKARELNLTAEEVVAVFKKCFFRSWLDAIVPKFSAVNEFRRLRQDERIALFKDLDKSHMEISKAMLLSKLISHLPNFDAFSSSGEIALVRREMAKQRKLMPTRLLIANLPNLLPAVKPCVMMSPLSVSTYLGSSNFEFDTVIFDEASQVRTEDAIGAISRAKQAIIAGDSKQLPPTDFFNSSMSNSDEFEEDEDGESNDTGAFDSLLDEATMLPTETLLWHYRSRHEHLIAFSNQKIYNGNLTTFPSSVEKSEGMGVEYIYNQGGTYDRGGKNGNRAEAARVAELVFEHFRKYPERSLGIIAFGKIQQPAIQDALVAKRQANPTFEPFFKEDKEESLFVKNLETVQGDERDTIIFSIGYAPDLSGKFLMNFGPLTRNGGERRLNVAVTRARYNLKLVGSILPTDIDTSRTSSQGVKLLRLYIDYAINGINAVLSETSTSESLWFDSPFEISVYDFLTLKGFDVVTQVGCSGYRIDMAIRHPKYNGRFAIGIECDGAMYHSARTARERDRLRQSVLEDMGWKIYRVWSTDWIKDRHTEGERLLSAVRQAIENYREIAPQPRKNANAEKARDFLAVSTQSVNEAMQKGVQEKFTVIRAGYYGYQAKDIPTTDIVETMLKVLSVEFGLDKTGLFKETALYGYGWQRQGGTIQQKFETAYKRLLNEGRIIVESEKIKKV